MTLGIRTILWVFALAACFISPAFAGGMEPSPMPEEESEAAPLRFSMDQIVLHYVYPRADLPSPELLKKTKVNLVKQEWGLSEKTYENKKASFLSVEEIEKLAPLQISAGALQEIIKALVSRLNEEGLMGVYVAPHSEDISVTGQDLREPDDNALQLDIFTASVSRVNTHAIGERLTVEGEESRNHQKHEWIRKHSPLRPAEGKDDRDDLLNRHEMDSYVYRLNRHPGRRVKASVEGKEDGKSEVTYNIYESKPLVGYFQLTDTGTGNTNEYQKRVGFIHNQLTDNDDILSVDYLTAGFDDYNAISLDYEAPWLWQPWRKQRFGIESSFNEFTSTDVGIQGADFTGKTTAFGFNLEHLLLQEEEWFLELKGGARWKKIEVNNEFAQIKGNETFLKPYFGLKLERESRLANTSAIVMLDTNLSGLGGTNQDNLAALGRVNTESTWWALTGAVRHSFFLEPLIFGDAFRDPLTPESSTLAHEVRLNARGQWVIGHDRLIPQEKFIAGGLYSVRGYPQSAVSGDSGLSGAVEYRLHAPRLLPINASPSASLFGDTFRMSPSQVYGYPDWDLVFKTFSDFGWVRNNNPVPGLEQKNETLWSIGTGLELQLRDNMRFQIDYGYALLDLESGEAQSGDSEIHFQINLFY